MIDLDRFWSDGTDDGGHPEGVSDEAVRAWEEARGIRLPWPLRDAFRRGDGGLIRETGLLILPLDEIAPMEDDFWRSEEMPEGDAGDPGLVFRAGHVVGIGGQILLNYNADGPQGEPSVYFYFNDGTGASLVGETLGGFLEESLATTPEPLVDWSESGREIDVIAREDFDVEYGDIGPARIEQVLGRLAGGSLVLFTREVGEEGVRLSKTVLPLPLDPRVTGVRRTRPEPGPTFGLDIHPEELDGIVSEESEQVGDPGEGRWKNRKERGVPAYVTFESPDRGRLDSLRVRLLGRRAEIGFIFEGMMG